VRSDSFRVPTIILCLLLFQGAGSGVARAFTPERHRNMTLQVLGLHFFDSNNPGIGPREAQLIADAAYGVDAEDAADNYGWKALVGLETPPSDLDIRYKFSPHHFDNNAIWGTHGGIAYVNDTYAEAVKDWLSQTSVPAPTDLWAAWYRTRALIQLGRCLHAIEDFYSHSNWIELQDQNYFDNTPPLPLWIGTHSGLSCTLFNGTTLTGLQTEYFILPTAYGGVQHTWLNKDSPSVFLSPEGTVPFVPRLPSFFGGTYYTVASGQYPDHTKDDDSYLSGVFEFWAGYFTGLAPSHANQVIQGFFADCSAAASSLPTTNATPSYLPFSAGPANLAPIRPAPLESASITPSISPGAYALFASIADEVHRLYGAGDSLYSGAYKASMLDSTGLPLSYVNGGVEVSRDTLMFAVAAETQIDGLCDTLNVRNVMDKSISFHVSTSVPWLTLEEVQGELSPGSVTVLRPCVVASEGFPPGEYTGVASVANDSTGAEQHVIVKLAVKAPTAISLMTLSTEAEPGTVRIAWYASGDAIIATDLYRQSPGSDWIILGHPEVSLDGRITIIDDSVDPDTRYGYRLVAHGVSGPSHMIETWIVTPSTASAPAVPGFGRLSPNPSGSQVMLRYGLPQPGRVRLVVYDLRGRKVASLIDGEKAAGWHWVEWNGRDEIGGRVASGVFFARLDVGGFNQTRKIVISK